MHLAKLFLRPVHLQRVLPISLKMTYAELDKIFPYIVFVYGILVSFVLASAPLMKIAQERLPNDLVTQLSGHRTLGLICLWVGGIWILQNLWLA